MIKLQHALVGGTGIGVSEFYNGFIAINPSTLVSAFHIVVQIAIAAGTLWHLFKPAPKPPTE